MTSYILADSEYSFDASNNTITLDSSWANLSIGQILHIKDVTTEDTLYDGRIFTTFDHAATISAGVITLTAPTGSHANTDKLRIEVKPGLAAISEIIVGLKSDVSANAQPIVATSTPIRKAVTVRVRSLGTGNWIAFGDDATQNFRLDAVGETLLIDFTDDLNKVYVLDDSGNTAAIEYIGS